MWHRIYPGEVTKISVNATVLVCFHTPEGKIEIWEVQGFDSSAPIYGVGTPVAWMFKPSRQDLLGCILSKPLESWKDSTQ